jgi:pimeloyl-ACP methyl ester carboxylesterase
VTSRFEYDGIRFSYEEIGAGAPLVMSHGLGGDRNQPKDLCGQVANHRVVVWDARAHGGTEPPGSEYALTLAGFAGDLSALLDHLRIERAVVGGISMGAAVSTRLALDFPERVTGLILVRPAWGAEPLPENLQLLPLVADEMQKHGAEHGRELFADRPEIRSMRTESPAVADSILQQFDKPFAMERRARLRRIPEDCPVRSWEEAKRISVPALVVGNAEDPMHPLAFAEQWAEHLPNATLAIIPSKSASEAEHTAGFRRALGKFLSG